MKQRKLQFFLLAVLMLSAAAAYGQSSTCVFYKETIDAIVNSTPGDARDRAIDRLLNITQGPRCFSVLAAGVDSLQEFARRLEASRPDKQSGTGGGSGGSTSIVAQGPTAKVISVAAEYGALTQSVSGQVVTVRGNLAGVPSALVRKDIVPYCVPGDTNGYCVGWSLLGILKRFSFGVSFDASRNQQSATGAATAAANATAQEVAFFGKKREISSLSARLELWNSRDINSSDFKTQWKAKVGEVLQQSAQDLLKTDFVSKVADLPAYGEWYRIHTGRIRGAGTNRSDLEREVDEALADLLIIVKERMPDYREQAKEAIAAYSHYFLAQDELIDLLSTKNVLALEYTNARPIGQAKLHNFRLIWDMPLDKSTKVVFNGAVEFYDEVPADAKPSVRKLRDAQVGLQVDHGLGRNALSSPATVSLAAYYQWQRTPSLLDTDPAAPLPGITFTGLPASAKTLYAETKNIFVAQAKLSLVPTGSSTKIPVSFTYSNRTELIARPTWRAQIGLTYDFDSLFSAFAK